MTTSVVVAGALAGKAGSGGEAWVRLSYALGLKRLGCAVRLVEEAAGADPRALAYAREAAEAFGFALDGAEAVEGADLLLNLSGNVRSEVVRSRFARTAYVDLDPGFTQLWHERGIEPIPEHDVYFTVATNLGADDCPIPTCGLRWHPTRPPVVLDEWPAAHGAFTGFTTVATWRCPFGRLEPYGLKHHEWRRFAMLPDLSGLPFEAALRIEPADAADRGLLERGGWRLVDPVLVSSPRSFRAYVARSGAEFSVAQGIYVETRSGWFSDRTVRYLASGKPALVQDTGFSSDVPVGEGLVSFRTLAEALDGAWSIVLDYERHARAARALAERCFDSDEVLRDLLEVAL